MIFLYVFFYFSDSDIIRIYKYVNILRYKDHDNISIVELVH